MKGDIPIFTRYAHSSAIYKNKIVFFGGEEESDLYKDKYLLDDVNIFNPETNEWKYVRPNVSATNDYVIARRSHVSCIIGHSMLVHGGIDCDGRHLSDMNIFDLKHHRHVFSLEYFLTLIYGLITFVFSFKNLCSFLHV